MGKFATGSHILLLVDGYFVRKYIQLCAGLGDIGIAPMAAQVVASPILVLVDDSPAFSEAVLEILRTKYRVAAAFSDGTSALDKIGVLSPDIVILDISLGDLSGFEVARRLKLSKCPAKIIFLTMHEDTDFVSAARDVGASGYVFKSCLTVDLTKAIDTVFHGGRFQSAALSSKVQ